MNNHFAGRDSFHNQKINNNLAVEKNFHNQGMDNHTGGGDFFHRQAMNSHVAGGDNFHSQGMNNQPAERDNFHSQGMNNHFAGGDNLHNQGMNNLGSNSHTMGNFGMENSSFPRQENSFHGNNTNAQKAPGLKDQHLPNNNRGRLFDDIMPTTFNPNQELSRPIVGSGMTVPNHQVAPYSGNNDRDQFGDPIYDENKNVQQLGVGFKSEREVNNRNKNKNGAEKMWDSVVNWFN